ncbi:MAG: Pr6Pr family membrane protein [Thermoanaerobaculia bacterium]
MPVAQRSSGRGFALPAAALGWLALAGQLFFTVERVVGRGGSVAAGVVRYLGYFTILTNLLVALAWTAHACGGWLWDRFFERPKVRTGIAAAIVLVGLAYALLLRNVWNPQGLEKAIDVVLHDVLPALFVAYWWIWVPKAALRWSDAFVWALYPLGYFVYTLLRGPLLAHYPYPFLDVAELGYGRTLVNGLGLLAVFLVVSWLLVAIGRLRREP